MGEMVEKPNYMWEVLKTNARHDLESESLYSEAETKF
jgi:hypothetical protein